MTAKMMQFVTVPQTMPDKRAVAERRRDFREIYDQFEPERAAEQAARCEQCGMPFCQVHCPLHNNIPDWLRLTAEGRLEEAYELAAATNNMPEICGRICPQDRLCEGNCVIEKGFEAVTIGAVEKHITDTAFEMGWVKPPKPRRERRESVGIIGAGPAGLAAAEQLRKQGYQVHVYDRHDRVGGLLIYGIPNFKLEKDVVAAPRAACSSTAASRSTSTARSAATSASPSCAQRHDAVFIGTGVYKARDIAAPGVGLGNIVPALDYLIASNRKGLGDARAGLRLRRARRRRQARGGDRRRRHRDGLRAHRGAPGRHVGDTASTAATAPTCRARCARCATPRRRASSSSGWRRPRRSSAMAQVTRACARCACVSARPTRPGGSRPEPIADSQLRDRGRPRDQGARLRSRGPAGAVRRARAGGDPLGHACGSTGRP